ncbi:S41 family peptidase [Arthrobacter sp. zg-Y826]|uniref:S41 family peptidase n=1 Tax=Arthrobacter jinronghuae TaxID=2964609 RepID=UPI002104C75D|nr:S41 family peptidase [Arthrobacter jinronghuae]MCQ1957441.1 S41 family peptidase [Arthrobacter jinronghuae]
MTMQDVAMSTAEEPMQRGPGYLTPGESGVSWMLDPTHSVLKGHAARQAAGPDSPADYTDYIADAEALKHLLRYRHVAVVLDPRRADTTDAVVDRWALDLLHRKPGTAAECAGSLGKDLGLALADGHLHVRHGQHHRPVKKVAGEDPGPPWEAATYAETRVVRIRSLDGSDGRDTSLRAGSDNNAADFSFPKLIVDLRGNGGGDDSYVISWFSPYVSEHWVLPCEETSMTLASSGSSIAFWNYAAWLGFNHHTVPDAFQQHKPQPADRIVTCTQPGAVVVPAQAAPVKARAPWTGRMIVVIDGGTGSSAESAALLLKSAFNAVLVGTPSYGVIDYGNSAPYYLPISGMEIHLPSQANDWGTAVDFVGIQPDVAVPAGIGIEAVVSRFDEFHAAGSGRPDLSESVRAN